MKPSYEELELKLGESQREFRAADATIENLQMQVEKLTAYLAVLTAEAAKCWHINLDCDDGKAVCVHCGKMWEV